MGLAPTLPHNIVLVSYAYLQEQLLAFTLRDGLVALHRLKVPPNIDQLVDHFLASCSNPSSDLTQLNRGGTQLYNILLSPLEADLNGASSLRIETDGVLDQLPFNLLAGPDKVYLGDRFEITLSQGTAFGPHLDHKSLLRAFSTTTPALIVIAAGPGSATQFSLPEADEEGSDIASYFAHPVRMSGQEMTPDGVLRALHDVRLFHFAGHAVDEVVRSGLVLRPNLVLTSDAIEKNRPRHLRLAVLAACDTANGEAGMSTDLNSVTRTLLANGVPTVVASRWRVDSAATRQLMRVFYSHLMAGENVASSLRASSIVVRQKPGFGHPYYWASFATFGEP